MKRKIILIEENGDGIYGLDSTDEQRSNEETESSSDISINEQNGSLTQLTANSGCDNSTKAHTNTIHHGEEFGYLDAAQQVLDVLNYQVNTLNKLQYTDIRSEDIDNNNEQSTKDFNRHIIIDKLLSVSSRVDSSNSENRKQVLDYYIEHSIKEDTGDCGCHFDQHSLESGSTYRSLLNELDNCYGKLRSNTNKSYRQQAAANSSRQGSEFSALRPPINIVANANEASGYCLGERQRGYNLFIDSNNGIVGNLTENVVFNSNNHYQGSGIRSNITETTSRHIDEGESRLRHILERSNSTKYKTFTPKRGRYFSSLSDLENSIGYNPNDSTVNILEPALISSPSIESNCNNSSNNNNDQEELSEVGNALESLSDASQNEVHRNHPPLLLLRHYCCEPLAANAKRPQRLSQSVNRLLDSLDLEHPSTNYTSKLGEHRRYEHQLVCSLTDNSTLSLSCSLDESQLNEASSQANCRFSEDLDSEAEKQAFSNVQQKQYHQDRGTNVLSSSYANERFALKEPLISSYSCCRYPGESSLYKMSSNSCDRLSRKDYNITVHNEQVEEGSSTSNGNFAVGYSGRREGEGKGEDKSKPSNNLNASASTSKSPISDTNEAQQQSSPQTEDTHLPNSKNKEDVDSMRAVKDIVKMSVPSLSSLQYLPGQTEVPKKAKRLLLGEST